MKKTYGNLAKLPYIDKDYGIDSLIIDKLVKLDSKLDIRFDLIEELLTNQVEKKLGQRNKVEYIVKENEEVLSQREILLQKVDGLLVRLRNEFDDLLNRLEIISLLKASIQQIKSITDKTEEKYYYRACILIHDSISHIKSEELTLQQVEVLNYLISKLKQETIDKTEFNDIDTILSENNLDWIPDLEDGF